MEHARSAPKIGSTMKNPTGETKLLKVKQNSYHGWINITTAHTEA